MQKKYRFVFNENTDLFCMQKKFQFVFNENTNLFFFSFKKKMVSAVYCKS